MKKIRSEMLRDCHCFNLRRVALAVTALYDKHLADADVTVQQFSILRHIHRGDPVSITALSKLMGLDRTTLSRNLALLSRSGLVSSRAHGRQKQLFLTPDGEAALDRAAVHWQAAQNEVENRLGSKEKMAQLEDLLAVLLTEA